MATESKAAMFPEEKEVSNKSLCSLDLGTRSLVSLVRTFHVNGIVYLGDKEGESGDSICGPLLRNWKGGEIKSSK